MVEARGPAISVVGDVQKDYRYELVGDSLTGQDVLDLARLKAGVSHVLLRGSRPEGPLSRYLPLAAFRAAEVRRGDEVLFSADQRDETIVVQVEGSYYGPSRYALPRNAKLGELLNAISVPRDMTSYRDVSIRRISVARQQAASLKESLRRLETTYLGYPSRTAKEGEIQVRQAELIERFVQKAAQVKPNGRLVVARDSGVADIRLQDGDIVTIPESRASRRWDSGTCSSGASPWPASWPMCSASCSTSMSSIACAACAPGGWRRRSRPSSAIWPIPSRSLRSPSGTAPTPSCVNTGSISPGSTTR